MAPKSKFLITVTSITGVAATSTVLSGGGGNKNPSEISHQEQKVFQKTNWQHKFIPSLTHAGDIQNNYQDLKCVNESFKEIINLGGGSTPASPAKDNERFPNNSHTKSCLVVEYYKQTYEGAWWWGDFRLVWSIKNEESGQGFLAAIDAKTKEGKLFGSSAAYIMKKEEGDGKWSILHSKERGESVIDNSEELEKLIPQTGYTLRAYHGISNIRWDFEPDYIWICEKSYCLENAKPENHKYFIWELSGGGEGGGLDEWCNNLNNWLNSNFGWGNVLGKLESVRGKWTKRET